ncbi:hypothetical protein [Sphingomonas sp.]|uniref:hypothetical protein n=1 Tax=Sphingomonas sp. TaxID=28214 RepID=UPI003D6C82ED
MAHDSAAFEGDWRLVEEGEPVDQADDQHWTLRAGKVFRRALPAGTYEVVCGELVLTMAAAAPHVARFRIPDAPLARNDNPADTATRPNQLPGYISYPAIDFTVKCMLMRAA